MQAPHARMQSLYLDCTYALVCMGERKSPGALPVRRRKYTADLVFIKAHLALITTAHKREKSCECSSLAQSDDGEDAKKSFAAAASGKASWSPFPGGSERKQHRPASSELNSIEYAAWVVASAEHKRSRHAAKPINSSCLVRAFLHAWNARCMVRAAACTFENGPYLCDLLPTLRVGIQCCGGVHEVSNGSTNPRLVKWESLRTTGCTCSTSSPVPDDRLTVVARR
eukprot:2831819-Pleurochrysis_carterae.AAC.5